MTRAMLSTCGPNVPKIRHLRFSEILFSGQIELISQPAKGCDHYDWSCLQILSASGVLIVEQFM